MISDQGLLQVLPAVLPALERNTRSHWNAAVLTLTANVRKMLKEMNGPLYDRCRLQFERDEVRPSGCDHLRSGVFPRPTTQACPNERPCLHPPRWLPASCERTHLHPSFEVGVYPRGSSLLITSHQEV